MKRMHVLMLSLVMLAGTWAKAQGGPGFAIHLEEVKCKGAPPLQSYAFGQHAGLWLVIGGRTDGLHRRQPFASFHPSGNNATLHVLDPVARRSWHQPLSGFPADALAQLQSSNMQFIQRDSILYLIGGYGWAPEAQEFITHPLLSAVNVPACIRAIQSGKPAAPHFRHLRDERMRVTGAQIGLLEGRFVMAGGQNFQGRYNPNGPDFGPGFYQKYANGLARFRIQDNGSSLAIQDYSTLQDSLLLHRRDLNMSPQILPGGRKAFTIFSGVFQHKEDVPWTTLVDISGAKVREVPDFEQLLSHYHCARLPIFDARSGAMHTIFFGGMARYYLDAEGKLFADANTPFVNTISRVTRDADGNVKEYALPTRMPGYLGASAEFIPVPNMPKAWDGILDLVSLPPGKHHVGYIYGGIESPEPNVLLVIGRRESWSSRRVFKVVVERLAE